MPRGRLPNTRSAELYSRARELLPGGVNSPVRAMRAIGRDPIFIADGAGAHITDVDGNDYIDWVCSWGRRSLVNAHRPILVPLARASPGATAFARPPYREVQ